MEKKDITGRADVDKLIKVFYAQLRKDDLLGPIFNSAIKDWDHHMAHIADFWERNLFGTTDFYGNPGRKHMEMDDKQNNTIEKKHFETWLSYWYATVDRLFEGDKAEEIKYRASTIGSNFFRMILNNRSRRFSKPSGFSAGAMQVDKSSDE